MVADTILLKGINDFEFLSEDSSQVGKLFMGREVLPLARASTARDFHLSIGNNAARSRLHRLLSEWGLAAASVIHPSATLAASAEISAGSFIAAGAILAPNCRVGNSSIINHRAVVDHDAWVGRYCHIAPGVILGGAVRIGDNVLVGAGAIVLPGIRIEDGAVVGAGAVVLDNVPQGVTVVGVPARQI